MILLNGLPDDRISISDRGLQYGDGLFETMVYRKNTIEYLDDHIARLVLGCKRLNIAFEQLVQLKQELNQICESLAADSAIIKIIITRGSGGRGYLAAKDVEPTRVISTHPLPSYPTENSRTGVKLRFCHHILSENITLAGLKHLNRLDQVLARNEWNDADIAEGLMQNAAGHIIEGTMSNVFIVKKGRILTPKLDKAGVAGIMRANILSLAQEAGIPIEECTITRDELLAADEVFMSNSVIGLWPVKSIDDTSFNIGPISQVLQSALNQAPE